MNPKIKKIRSSLKERRLDALLVTNETNVSYLTGIPIADSCLLLTKKKNIILTDFRYLSEAGAPKDFILKRIEPSFALTLATLIKSLSLKKIGFEGKSLPYNAYTKIKKALKGAKLLNASGIIEEMRMIKSSGELKILKEAIKISKDTFSYIKRVFVPGITEKKLAEKIDTYIRSHGGERAAFPTIVASGPNAARPHAITTSRKIKQGEPVIIDCGVRHKGYNSDLTRTFYLGKIDSKFSAIYNIINIAQQKAISHIKPGRIISRVDHIARDFIARAGFGEQFGHALGHGIGREVHESPKIFKNTKMRLSEGMILAIEPAIYIKGWGGVRIEDMVLVTKDGCTVLTDDIDKSI